MLTAIFSLLFAAVGLLALIAWELRPKKSDAAEAPAKAEPLVELLTRSDAGWAHHSWREADHRDIQEALDTPGLAVRFGGVIKEGRQ